MDKDKIAIVLISAAIIVAGCTNGEDEEIEGEGLQITQFNSFPADPFTGESTNLEMELFNTGDADADVEIARLYGHVISDDDNAWSLDGDEQVRDDIGIVQAGDEDFDPLPEDVVWRMIAPEEISQSTSPYTWNAEVFYDYRTDASTSIDLIDSRDEQAGIPGVSNSAAPIRLDVTTQSPILVDEETDEVQVRVEASNIGQGEVYSPDTEFEEDPFDVDDDEYRDSLTIRMDDPPGETSVDGENEVDVDMTRGSGRHTFDLSLPESFNSPLTVELSLESDYIYRTDRATGVTVGER